MGVWWMPLEYRALSPRDMEAALSLAWTVFLEFEAPEYSAEGIEEFRKYVQPCSIIRLMDKQELFGWGCFAGEQIVGMIAIRPSCHISLLFVDKAYHRRGIAKTLLGQALEQYLAGGHKEITVNSSPYGKEAYHRMGFQDTGEEQTVNGIRFIPMKKALTASFSG